jgi:hypothetical protein
VKIKRSTGYLNVDVDVESSRPLEGLAEEIGDAVVVLHVGPITRRRFMLRMESRREAATPDTAARDLCKAIERLSARGRELWDAAKYKEFNVGFDLPTGVRVVEAKLQPETVSRIVALGATVAFSCYRDDSEPDGAANGSQPIRSETNRTSPAAGSRR